MNSQKPPFWGKYRGLVREHGIGPDLGKIRVQVADILGKDKTGMAEPALPYAGKNVGLFIIPPVDAWVWIEFLHGDPQKPIWTGCCWGPNELPNEATLTDIKVLKTAKATVLIDDNKGELTLQLNGGPKIALTSSGIKLENGKGATIELSGNSVKINDNALEVT